MPTTKHTVARLCSNKLDADVEMEQTRIGQDIVKITAAIADEKKAKETTFTRLF